MAPMAPSHAVLWQNPHRLSGCASLCHNERDSGHTAMLETTPQHPPSEVFSSCTDTALQQPQAQQDQPPGSKTRLNKFINDRSKAQDYRDKAERPSDDYKHLGNGCCLHRAHTPPAGHSVGLAHSGHISPPASLHPLTPTAPLLWG